MPNIGPYTESHFQGLVEELEQAREKLKLRDRLSLWLAEKRISFAGRCWRLKLRIKMYLGLVEGIPPGSVPIFGGRFRRQR